MRLKSETYERDHGILDIYGVIWLLCANKSEASCITSHTIVSTIGSQPYRHRLRGIFVGVDAMALNQSSARNYLPRIIAKLKHFGDQDGWRVGIAGNEIAWSRALGPNWTLPFADVDLLYTASEGVSS